ncbi:hypothetical protein P7K49_013303, partial [Saguinus oedipus]
MLLPPPAPSRAAIGHPARPSADPAPPRPPAARQPLAAVALRHLPLRAPPPRLVSNEELVNYGSAPPPARPPRAPGRPSIGPLGPAHSPSAPTPRPGAAQPRGRTPYERQRGSTHARLPAHVLNLIGSRSCQFQGAG